MERIVVSPAGAEVHRGHVGGGYELARRDLGNGHVEYFVRELVTWEHVCDMSEEGYAEYIREREAAKEERHQANLNRACRRARVRIRQRCKASGVDSLLTLTYKANVTELAIAKAHLKAFTRKMKRLIPGFFYIAVFERQKRGAWHIHMAIHRLPKVLPHAGVKVKSYSVVRAVWLSVTGELGGNVDESRRKRYSRPSSGKVAAYLSKYMGKAFEELDGGINRYSSSDSITLPPAVRMRFVGYELGQVLRAMLDDMSLAGAIGDQIQMRMPQYKGIDGELHAVGCVWGVVDLNAGNGNEREARYEEERDRYEAQQVRDGGAS